MNDNLPNLPLQVANDIEQSKSWEGIHTPADFARYLATILTVNPNQIVKLQEVIANSVEPVGIDKGKIWIKTESPQGIGVPIGGSYLVIYKYPPNVPLLWVLGNDALPSYMTKLTQIELDDYSLTAPDNTSYYYVIFRDQ